MTLKFCIACFLMVFVAFGVALGMVYCSGRWGLAIGPEIGFPEGIGVVIWILGCIVLLQVFGKQGVVIKCMAMCLSLVLLLTFFSRASGLMVRVYVTGFQQAVFNVASPEQWSSIPAIMKKNRERLTEQEILSDEQGPLPDFVWKAFPLTRPETPNNYRVIDILQRGWSFDRVLEIGDLKSYNPDFNKIIYQADYSNNMSFLLIGGG